MDFGGFQKMDGRKLAFVVNSAPLVYLIEPVKEIISLRIHIILLERFLDHCFFFFVISAQMSEISKEEIFGIKFDWLSRKLCCVQHYLTILSC